MLITRVFDAPREIVFRAWIDPEQLGHWFAPRGCTVLFQTIDPREGGEFHFCIGSPNGRASWCKGAYRELVAPERMVFTMVAADENGAATGPAEVGMNPPWPRETIVTATFAEVCGKTQVTFRRSVAESSAERTRALASWLEMFDRLGEELDYICELAR
jgi:uncharacterized protein YndB with AHSA1/START domain